jgi:hypothetical protein
MATSYCHRPYDTGSLLNLLNSIFGLRPPSTKRSINAPSNLIQPNILLYSATSRFPGSFAQTPLPFQQYLNFMLLLTIPIGSRIDSDWPDDHGTGPSAGRVARRPSVQR